MTKEQIEALRKKWEEHDGKTIEKATSTEGLDAAEFIESLAYSKILKERPGP